MAAGKFPCNVTARYAGTYRGKYKDPGAQFVCHTPKEFSDRWMIRGKSRAKPETKQVDPETLSELQGARAGEAAADDQGPALPDLEPEGEEPVDEAIEESVI